MNDTKPTANAARTVVSTPPLIGRGRPCRRRAGGGPRGRARARPRRAPSSRRPRQRSAATPTPSSAISDSSARDEPGRHVEAAALGHGEHLRPVLLDQRGLDLGLALALGDPPPDELALAVGDRRGGHVERRAALHAHDLVLDVGQRGLRLGGERRGSQHEREQQSEREPHDVQRIPRPVSLRGPRGRCPMAKTVASQATNGGSIPLARSPARRAPRYQACGVPQCGQHGDAVTSPVQAKPHSQEYSARSSRPLPRRARTWETESAGAGGARPAAVRRAAGLAGALAAPAEGLGAS